MKRWCIDPGFLTAVTPSCYRKHDASSSNGRTQIINASAKGDTCFDTKPSMPKVARVHPFDILYFICSANVNLESTAIIWSFAPLISRISLVSKPTLNLKLFSHNCDRTLLHDERVKCQLSDHAGIKWSKLAHSKSLSYFSYQDLHKCVNQQHT